MNNDFGMLGAKYEAAGFKLYKDCREQVTSRDVIRLSLIKYRSKGVRKTVIRLSIAAAKAIGNPSFIRVSFDEGGRRAMVQRSEAEEEGALALLNSGGHGGLRYLYNLGMIELILKISGETLTPGDKIVFFGEPAKSVPGAIIFDLSKPERKTIDDR